jgi:hypothetical protein
MKLFVLFSINILLHINASLGKIRITEVKSNFEIDLSKSLFKTRSWERHRIRLEVGPINLTPCTRFQQVLAGDTCLALSQNVGLTLDLFMALNPGLNCATLAIKSSVCVAGREDESLQSMGITDTTGGASKSNGTAENTTETMVESTKETTKETTKLSTTTAPPSTMASESPPPTTTPTPSTPPPPKSLPEPSQPLPGLAPPPPPPPPPIEGCSASYTVVDGDNCDSVANGFGLSLEVLSGLNSGFDCGLGLVIGWTLCVGGPAPPPPLPPPPTPIEGCSAFYTVIAGDYCYAIATSFSLSLEALNGLNSGLDCVIGIDIGWTLCVGGPAPPPPPPPPPTHMEGCSETYTVVAGDTCQSIADAIQSAQIGIQWFVVEKLIELNSGLDCVSSPIVGWTLCVGFPSPAPPPPPPPTPVDGCGLTYIVVDGDNCDSVANGFSLSLETLNDLNSGLDCGLGLVIGWTLCVDGAFGLIGP